MKQKLLLFFMAFSLSSFYMANAESANVPHKEANVYTLEKLMEAIDTQVGKEVKVRGIVTHVCKHSGKKCFITGESGKGSLQVMAKGKITAFDKELVGSEIEVSGKVQEYRMEKEAIDGREQSATEMKEKGEVTMEQCDAVMNNVKEMREWMEKNNKDYFAIFYVDGETYEVVD